MRISSLFLFVLVFGEVILCSSINFNNNGNEVNSREIDNDLIPVVEYDGVNPVNASLPFSYQGNQTIFFPQNNSNQITYIPKNCSICNQNNYLCTLDSDWNPLVEVKDPRLTKDYIITEWNIFSPENATYFCQGTFTAAINGVPVGIIKGGSLNEYVSVPFCKQRCGVGLQCKPFVLDTTPFQYPDVCNSLNQAPFDSIFNITLTPNLGNTTSQQPAQICIPYLVFQYNVTYHPNWQYGQVCNTVEKKFPTGIVIGATVGGLALILIIIIIIIVVRNRIVDKKMESEMQEISNLATIPILKDIIIKDKIGDRIFSGIWNETQVALIKVHDYDKFIQEAHILFSLNHPHIVQFLGKFDSNKTCYVVTEYIGQTLTDLLQSSRDKLNIIDLLDIMIGACKGMVFLSQKDILQKNLKASKLLISTLDGKYLIKIMDFNLAGINSNPENKISVKWSSPELIQTKTHSIASDMYTFGVVCWEVLSYGVAPYANLTDSAASKQITQGSTLPKPSGCDSQLWGIIQETWKKNPADRITFGDLLRQLQDVKNIIRENLPMSARKITNIATPVISNSNNTSGGSLSGSNNYRGQSGVRNSNSNVNAQNKTQYQQALNDGGNFYSTPEITINRNNNNNNNNNSYYDTVNKENHSADVDNNAFYSTVPPTEDENFYNNGKGTTIRPNSISSNNNGKLHQQQRQSNQNMNDENNYVNISKANTKEEVDPGNFYETSGEPEPNEGYYQTADVRQQPKQEEQENFYN